MSRHTFFCIDGHTCGNPIRLIAGGTPWLEGHTMREKQAHFLAEYDWIRAGLMREPRGNDIMVGSLLCPPTREDCDVGIFFVDTKGGQPMCGHGTIGTVTMAIENGLVTTRTPGTLRLDTPAGVVTAEYRQEGQYVEEVRIRNIPSFVHSRQLTAECAGLGTLTVDVAYGGNFYAIVDRQEAFRDIADASALDLVTWSRRLRHALNEAYSFIHPEHPDIRGLTHVMWTGAPRNPQASGRNAVFYCETAIDRSPCGTGTSARMAQWAALGRLSVGDDFVHESIIGSLFHGRVEATARVGNIDAIVPSIAGWARVTGLNTITIDDRDPFAHGFEVT
jgi:4-hydroxyproline epimerase